MQHIDSPFKAAWWGIALEDAGLGSVRPDQGTYGEYSYEALPPLPCALDGSFSWLRQYAPCDAHVGVERGEDHERVVSMLLADAVAQRVGLPREFVAFMRDGSGIERVRSNTDCYIDLCQAPVPSPIGNGHLVRFFADSQGCLFWYLYVPSGSDDHCVVVSPRFYGLPEEDWQDEPPDHSELRFCAESFEAFLCRFVLENEIWLLTSDGEELGPFERAYVEGYGVDQSHP